MAAFIDAEHALDPDYAKKLGVDLNNLMVNQPDTGEQALEIAELLVRSNAVAGAAIDSRCSLVLAQKLRERWAIHIWGYKLRLMSQALRKLTGCISKIPNQCYFYKPDSRKDRRYVRRKSWKQHQVEGH